MFAFESVLKIVKEWRSEVMPREFKKPLTKPPYASHNPREPVPSRFWNPTFWRQTRVSLLIVG